MPRGTIALAGMCLLALAGQAHAAVREYQLDPVHTRIAFQVDHAGFSRAIGTFSGATGTLRFDPADWTTATLSVAIPLDSLDLGDAEWRERVLDRSFLDAGAQPVARFTSTRVEPTGEGTARVFGELSLRGATREVALDVTLNALKRHPLTFRRTAGFSATGTLVRQDFGMTAWEKLVGAEVTLQIEAEAIRGRADGAREDDEANPTPDRENDDAAEE
ncbi:YceI family protein [Arenimonas sp.]|uniref:YceI family protein n=1 Tax=Arenimonas sp. TaxID=1872635 RepID=UPI002E343AD9|nr:YceI family protein [Arenimonas sp.]HEX4854405.1 YceI family protein [Arenimonas sp.]